MHASLLQDLVHAVRLHAVLFLILLSYLAAVMYIGFKSTKKQKSLDDFFLAGRTVPWWAAGVSIITADMSAISYVGAPAWVFQKDLRLAVGLFLFPLFMLVIVYLFIPIMARLRLFTIYEYLEKRFGLPSRLLASLMFILIVVGRLAVVIYTTSLILSVIAGLPVTLCIWVLAGVTATYTVLGGMEAVIWTDVMQFCVLVFGMILILAVIVYAFGGHVGQIWSLAAQGGHTTMLDANLFSVSLKTEVTLLALIVGGAVTNVATYGSDQVIVQRYLTTGSKREMAKAVMFNGIVTLPVMGMLWLAGVGLAAYYAVHPALAATLTAPDQVVPHFITNALNPVVGGLIIAGIFAATMSTLSCGLNSLTTASMVDFYLRFRGQETSAGLSDKSTLAGDISIARWCTLGWAIFSTIGAMFVDHLGTIIKAMGTINGFFVGPLLSVFLLGFLTTRANSFGAFGGAIAGTALTAVVAAMPVSWLPAVLQPSSVFPISWLWYGPAGCLFTLIVGYLLSLTRPAPAPHEITSLTLRAQLKQVVALDRRDLARAE
ncbi:MAG: sodium/solute symporter [Acidobacteria bacterium]|nr:sodium/solute symporter [Acidobacteriota bacterium]